MLVVGIHETSSIRKITVIFREQISNIKAQADPISGGLQA